MTWIALILLVIAISIYDLRTCKVCGTYMEAPAKPAA